MEESTKDYGIRCLHTERKIFGFILDSELRSIKSENEKIKVHFEQTHATEDYENGYTLVDQNKVTFVFPFKKIDKI